MEKYIRDEKGYSLVEFALVLPIMLIILGLIFDIGRAIHIKTNLQHLAGEIQKVVVLYEEAGTKGGMKTYSSYKGREELVNKVIDENTTLDKTKLTHRISTEGVEGRRYTGHHYNFRSGQFVRTENRNDIEYITATVEYYMPYSMFVTKTILGESIKLSESYTGLMYVGGDGWD
ncbi:Flp pilus assembly protein TadG [Tissierella praeacuta DSM 18095]|uniref:Flp pilus assembly protein TadG n=1 Tax=Tissierella praeacuta DSM 18095 TaxID=1123404 RepID=A0A1M4XIQ0_9FIRM|nr:TadE/TadG family type IV pilus assembly protein [Tissierella praeacuta]TCU67836.1 Flp pilus assembly protein TadG [Tissierella praeacuta]SHE93379.1 Flp pilus assembly protein TadG [Tissierella praeacuta DSM 18095]SUP02082.1 Flp pilus assembly protein TadG [Tissierella praeacuta]